MTRDELAMAIYIQHSCGCAASCCDTQAAEAYQRADAFLTEMANQQPVEPAKEHSKKAEIGIKEKASK